MENQIVNFGNKAVSFTLQESGSWVAACHCRIMDALVEVPLSAEQVAELLRIAQSGQGRRIQDILTDTDYRLREIFLTGLTPAEWDRTFLGRLRSKADYLKLGYRFDR